MTSSLASVFQIYEDSIVLQSVLTNAKERMTKDSSDSSDDSSDDDSDDSTDDSSGEGEGEGEETDSKMADVTDLLNYVTHTGDNLQGLNKGWGNALSNVHCLIMHYIFGEVMQCNVI